MTGPSQSTVATVARLFAPRVRDCLSPFLQHSARLSPSTSLSPEVTQSFDGREQVAGPFVHKGRCSDLDGSLPDVRIIHRREQDDSRVRVVLLDLTTDIESVDVRQVEVDHNNVRLESLRGV